MKHRVLRWFIPIISIGLTLPVVVGGIASHGGDLFAITLRPFSIGILIAIAVTLVTLITLTFKAKLQSGSFYWFYLFTLANLFWQALTFLNVSAIDPATSAFWQGMMPFAWMQLGLWLLFFAVSYLDNNDLPRSVGLFVVPLVCLLALSYTAAAFNVIESHVPHLQHFNQYWGYSNTPEDLETFAFAWVFIAAFTNLILFIRAYRRTVNRSTKKQLRLFIIGTGQYIILAVSLDIILYSLNPNVPTFGPFYGAILCVVIGYGIVKHGLFKISPQALAVPILENLSEAVIAVNKDLYVEFTNRGAENMLAHHVGGLRGNHIQQIFGPEHFKSVLERLKKGEESFSFEDIPVKGIGHSRIPVSMTVSAFSYEQKVAGYIFVLQNISALKQKTFELASEKQSVERKVAERTKELHEERAKLRASIESLEVGFAFIDRQGRIIIKNKRLAEVFEGAELATIGELESKLHNVKLRDKRWASIGHHRNSVIETLFKDRTLKIFIAGVRSTKTSAQAPDIGTLVLVEDVTELRVMERSRDEFFSIASHELRTPLTAIRGNASMLLSYPDMSMNNEDFREAITDIHDASIGLIDIVNDFLDMSRLEQGKIHFNYEECRLDRIIENVMYEMKLSIRERHLFIRFNGMSLDVLPPIWADPARVKQIMYNLVSNAIKFTEKGGITINASATADEVTVEIADTGRGIPAHSQKLLFRKFQQAGDSLLTRDTSRGTGLGLYISRLMARTMRGDVKLVRSDIGVGTVFALTLLRSTDDHKQQATEKLAVIDIHSGMAQQSKKAEERQGESV